MIRDGDAGDRRRAGPVPDRTLRAAEDLDALRFDERGLVCVVAQDAREGAVLMVAWANREALERSLQGGEMHFWSRSRGAPWRKGETSGNVLRVRSLHADCDGDTVLALVDPAGPACHTGQATCFGGAAPARDPLDVLWDVLESRARDLPAASYTTRLLEDENLRIKKLGEETAELVSALARGDETRVRSEAGDLLYHLLVALLAAGVSLDELRSELLGRLRFPDPHP